MISWGTVCKSFWEKKRINGGRKQHLKKERDFFFFFSFLACAFYLVPERKVNKVKSLSVSIKTTCGEEKTGRRGVGGALGGPGRLCELKLRARGLLFWGPWGSGGDPPKGVSITTKVCPEQPGSSPLVLGPGNLSQGRRF